MTRPPAHARWFVSGFDTGLTSQPSYEELALLRGEPERAERQRRHLARIDNHLAHERPL